MELKRIGKRKVVSIRHVGPYSEVGKAFRDLVEWCIRNEIIVTGPAMGIYYDDPREVPPEKCTSEIMFPIEELPELPEEEMRMVEIKELPEMRVVSKVMRGESFNSIDYEKEYNEIVKWMEERGLKARGPPIEIYHKFEGMVEIEVQVPVE
ncbi:hypothetical protein DRN46_01640 [Thermococci archaeon]|nr:MAG: hypothetical protein DRN46_01640 [Thermococci archaeon]